MQMNGSNTFSLGALQQELKPFNQKLAAVRTQDNVAAEAKALLDLNDRDHHPRLPLLNSNVA